MTERSGDEHAPYRLTEADVADIGMGLEMWQASPDGQEHYRRRMDSLPDVTVEVRGHLCRFEQCEYPGCGETAN